MKNLMIHIQGISADIPMDNKNIIVYDPLPYDGNMRYPQGGLTHQTSHNYHLRPSVKRGISDNPHVHLTREQLEHDDPLEVIDLEHDDLLELFGHDEKRGLSTILLVQGTEIEIPIEDEQGVTF